MLFPFLGHVQAAFPEKYSHLGSIIVLGKQILTGWFLLNFVIALVLMGFVFFGDYGTERVHFRVQSVKVGPTTK